MPYQYRVLRQDIVSGLVEDTYYKILIDAYRACIPDNKTHECHVMINGIKEKLNSGETLIRVTCYPTVVYWLESLVGKIDLGPIPVLPSKIECCHPP
jgi:hypothetical protein